MSFKTRKKWENDAGNQQTHPLRLYRASTLQDLVDVVREAERLAVRVRAVGSGHSWSDVAVNPDFMVLPADLSRVLPLDTDVLKDTAPTDTLVELQSGVTLRKLNEHLDDLGLALPNMGGFDGQTIVGATATSTHGSGLKFGPLTEMIRSIDVVAGTGRVLRIEPGPGYTDPAKYETKYGTARTLIQDEDAFYALGVGVGSLGLIYSVVIEVVPAFWLEEVRELHTWEQVKTDLIKGDVFDRNDHYELLLNPYPVDGAHACLVTTRNRTDPPGQLPPDKTNRNFLTEILASLSVTSFVLRHMFNTQPQLTPEFINRALRDLEDRSYINKSYKVFNIGAANDLRAMSAEYGFTMTDHHYIAAIDSLIRVAAHAAANGKAYQTGPIAIRFVRGTPFFLSPQFGRHTAMTEMIAVSGTISTLEMLYRYEEQAYAMGGRPHWGQINHVAGLTCVSDLYPAVHKWSQVRETIFDRGRTFDAPFTRRVGL